MTELGGHDAHVLILGASFTGVELLRLLRRQERGEALEVIVVDRQRTHPYIPLSHELLCDRMSYGVPGATELETASYVESRPPARWIEGEIVGFDPDAHEVTLGDGRRFSGRFVVVALGSELRPPAALVGGERMVAYKFKAELERCRATLHELLAGEGEQPTILVAGGGITGVEVAGELGHLTRVRPQGWRAPRVVMVQGGERLLPSLSARAGAKAAAALRAQGVELHLGTRLVSIGEHEATIRGSEGELTIPCALSFWAGGVQPPTILASLGLPLTSDGWLRVGPSLRCSSGSVVEAEIFAGGDVARVYGAGGVDGDGRWPTMQRAIECIFAAQTIARNITTLARSPSRRAALTPHRLWSDFPHGVSIGGRSLIIYGRFVSSFGVLNIWFRRFLMRQYMRRYRP